MKVASVKSKSAHGYISEISSSEDNETDIDYVSNRRIIQAKEKNVEIENLCEKSVSTAPTRSRDESTILEASENISYAETDVSVCKIDPSRPIKEYSGYDIDTKFARTFKYKHK